MPNDNDIVVKKIRCSIRIENSNDLSNIDIKNYLRRRILEFFPENRQETLLQNENSLEEFIKYYYYSTQGRELNNLVYFIDYQERAGSFIMDFSFLIITTFTSYTSTRQGIDTFINDISSVFRDALNTSRVVGVIEKEVDILNQNNLNYSHTIKPIIGKNIQAIVPYVSFFISVFIALFLVYYNAVDSKSKTATDEILLDYKIQKNLNDALNRQKLDYLFYTHYINDTTNLGKLRQRILNKNKETSR